jgi:hypothetical protein
MEVFLVVSVSPTSSTNLKVFDSYQKAQDYMVLIQRQCGAGEYVTIESYTVE